MEVWVDAEHAGCVSPRKSITGVVLILGKRAVRNTCNSQAVIALSSGEAEYCQAIGEQSFLADWSIRVDVICYMDAPTGLVIGKLDRMRYRFSTGKRPLSLKA